MAVEKTPDKHYINVLFDESLLRRIDDFRFKHRFASRTEGMRWLIDAALKGKLASKYGDQVQGK
jgi:metal-responsive CopG/Arc/MetJ family transcriptional regulator